MVVKHVYLKVLTINPPKEYKCAIFPPNLNSFHSSEGAHTSLGEGKTQRLLFKMALLLSPWHFFLAIFYHWNHLML